MSESAFDDQLTLADSFEYFCLIFLGARSVFGQGLARAQRRFVFARRGNLGFAFEKVLVAQ